MLVGRYCLNARLAFVHCLLYPSRWELLRDIADRYLKLPIFVAVGLYVVHSGFDYSIGVVVLSVIFIFCGVVWMEDFMKNKHVSYLLSFLPL